MEEMMYIDGHPLEKEELRLSLEGKKAESRAKQQEFLDKVEQSGIDHCPCTNNCPLHGDCRACVLVHRGHRDHLPVCFFSMINERLQAVSSLTEGTFEPEKR